MGKNINKKSLNTILAIIIIVWLVFLIVPFIVYFLDSNLSTIKLLGVSFSAATALFTGIAFAVAFHSLSKQQESLIKQQENLELQQESLDMQQKTLIKQIDLSVFIDSIGLLMNNWKFNNCQDYIYSNNFLDDIKKVRKILNMDDDCPVSLNDYRSACKIFSGSKDVDESKKKSFSDSYEKIKYFCNRMEFLGVVVSKEEAAKELILSYYKITIKDTYNRLSSLIEATRNNKDSANLYGYYTELYNTVIANEKNQA